MIKRITERWKELRDDDGFGKLSVKQAIIFMIRETIHNKWTSFIINRYGKDSFYLKNILKDNKDKHDYHWDYKHISFLYYDVMEDSKEEVINKLMVSVKLLCDYNNMMMYISNNLKTSAYTEQYHDASWKLYGETQIWRDWGECDGFMTDGHCEHCDRYIKDESDKIKKQLKLK